jgi:adenosylhomocysteinase
MTAVTPTPELRELGEQRLAWIRSRMRLLADAKESFAISKPFEGQRIGVAIHLEPKTAVLLEVLSAGGAEIVATGNHGSTQDDTVAALLAQGMTIFGTRADTMPEHLENVESVLDAQPTMILDNGADLIAGLVERGLADSVIGATEETTSGGSRLRGDYAGRVPFPVIVINDSPLKAIGENRHAVGQSVVESLMRITALMIPGRRFVVVGYGWCGRGIAQYLRAFGGKVAIAEVDDLKAFEAALDGYRVAPIGELAGWGQTFVTATGHPGVLGAAEFAAMESGTVLANSGHFPTEIDVPALKAMATSVITVEDSLERIEFADGRHVILVADGRMVNLAGRNPRGNSLESMDLGFLLQALSLERLATSAASLDAGPQPVPDDINRIIARRMVAAMSASR